jgi:hypothetical protein
MSTEPSSRIERLEDIFDFAVHEQGSYMYDIRQIDSCNLGSIHLPQRGQGCFQKTRSNLP